MIEDRWSGCLCIQVGTIGQRLRWDDKTRKWVFTGNNYKVSLIFVVLHLKELKKEEEGMGYRCRLG